MCKSCTKLHKVLEILARTLHKNKRFSYSLTLMSQCMEELCNSCNMGMGDLPDMYAFSPWASGIHIRQITNGHVTSTLS